MAKPQSPLFSSDSTRVRDIGDARRADWPLSSPRVALPANAESGSPARLPSHLSLAHGQSFYAYMGLGTVLHIERGDVLLTAAPRWLAASFWRSTVPLSAGQVHVVETSGWVTLSAGTGARIALREAADDSARPAALRSHAARLRQVIR
ncbi:hypothetical protein PHO31112_01395 [Pandoraea horticolens]|uniref:Uncharacterized protein n=1 Tax=Pandoraea horticolens TaxID=2508298 RepID=A0A5E4THW9_9BURK|nr:hypothetical protein [Pandoraea horticolens]VVD86623.1 hypothetical protein PHO31112_01395 [Pandoraea horticolens]